MERLSAVWAFPAGAGRAVAVSHGHFTNNNKIAVRPFSLASRVRMASPLPSLTQNLAIIFLYLLAIESRKII